MFPLEVTDALGRAVALPAAPQRIVSLVPSLSELLAHLDLDVQTVGITRFCVLPPEWKQTKTVVGGTKQVRAERVAELQPDLILANKEENTRQDVEALAALAPVYVTDVATVEQAMAMIRAVGSLVDRADAADRLAGAVDAEFATLSAMRPLRIAYLIWREPLMVAGGGTFIDDVLRRGSYENVFRERPRYPEVSLDALRAAAPEVLLLSSEPFPFQEKHALQLRAELPHVRTQLVDGQLFSWYGSRIRETPAYLRELREELAS